MWSGNIAFVVNLFSGATFFLWLPISDVPHLFFGKAAVIDSAHHSVTRKGWL